MRKFFTRFFVVIGVLTTFMCVGAAVTGWYTISKSSTAKAPESMILTLDFSKPIIEREDESPLAMLLHYDEETTSLLSAVRSLERAKNDPRVKAVVARFGSDQPSFVHAQEIRAALLKVTQAGKPTYAFATTYGAFGAGNRSYYLASAFQEVWLQPAGTVSLTGLGVEAPFGKTALGNIGVSGDFLQREEYKSAMESFTRDAFSPAAKADLEAMMKSLNEQLTQGIAENRGWELAQVQDLIARGPYTANEAMKHKLVTRLGYEDELLQEVETKVGKEAKQTGPETYLAYATKGLKPKATVALIVGSGMITDTPSGSQRLASDDEIDADAMADAFHEAAKDKSVKAIIFRINSPGGSPVASETIRHAIIRAKAANKPVFVSMGEVAASGGYWVSMDADHIVADPATITGSIGVVAGKFVTDGLWQKLGVKWDRLATSPNAKLWSTLEPYDAAGRERMNALLDETYDMFVSNVSAARKIPIEKMPEIAKGRVWTGAEAVKVGLVDEIGGFSTTILAVKKHLKLEADDPVALKQFPEPAGPAILMRKLLKAAGIEGVFFRNFSSELRMLKSVLGPLHEAATMTPVTARIPEGVLKAVR